MFVIIVVLGLSLGSFINALVWRLHKQSTSVRNKHKYSITRGRSLCPKCNHRLNALDLIPIVSWLLLRGKCRYCKKPISITYPLIEFITTLLFILSYIYWPLKFNSEGIVLFVLWLAILVLVISLALYDVRWLKLPNRLVYPLLVAVLLQVLITVIFFNGRSNYLLNSLIGLLIGGGVFYLLFQISGGKWIGGGDVKLGGILGLYLGSPSMAILMIFFASVLGILASIPLLTVGKINRKTLIPYGPFLIVATIILRLFGSSIISWLSSKGFTV